MFNKQLDGIDGVLYSLRELFLGYGYTEYKMNKFEEYDLYAKNKDFLLSSNIITFTDTNGKLLALKPDVTLSIVKNAKVEDGVQKLFYSENVYRVSSKNNGYREIAQMGLECIGDVDDYNVAEVLMLACESLKRISSDCVLDVSPIGLISAYIDKLNLAGSVKKAAVKCINEKNEHELRDILSLEQIDEKSINVLSNMLGIYAKADEAIIKLKELFDDDDLLLDIERFENMLAILPKELKQFVYIDCSALENVKYYNSITFKGYVNGVPSVILSGGRYDGLLKRIGKNCGAIGFAIYPDEFDRLFLSKNEYDVDVVIVYSNLSSKAEVLAKMKQLFDEGKTVTALKKLSKGLTYKEIIEM